MSKKVRIIIIVAVVLVIISAVVLVYMKRKKQQNKSAGKSNSSSDSSSGIKVITKPSGNVSSPSIGQSRGDVTPKIGATRGVN